MKCAEGNGSKRWRMISPGSSLVAIHQMAGCSSLSIRPFSKLIAK
jgi:hypothetical protein